MAVKRIVETRTAEERTYEKLRRDLEIMTQGRPGRGRKAAELTRMKAKIAVRRRLR